MDPSAPKDVAAELAFQAEQATQVAITPTPRDIIERYRRCPEWRVYRKEYVFKQIHDLRPTKILDFGCGSGDSSTKLGVMGYDVVGIDVSPELIALAEEPARLDGVADKVKFIAVSFETLNVELYTVRQRLMRLLPEEGELTDWVGRFLAHLDFLLLRVPRMAHFVTSVALLGRKRISAQ